MKTYLVGGAVRDLLLGRESKDKDYVVVGATPEDMEARGFQKVGADFPVFLHPETRDEYSLARQERKTGKGYLGFETRFSPDISLEDDLKRRDLTINSMAMDNKGNILSPWGGKEDLLNRTLRHTSEAFSEDPVRILRIARFRARLGEEWSISNETKEIIKDIKDKNILSELTSERVWLELEKSLREENPRLFFDTLKDLDVLEKLFPIIYKMTSVEEPLKWHPEGNTYEHTMLVLTAARKLTSDSRVLFSALTHDFGKTVTDPKDYPKHYGHEKHGLKPIEEFCSELRVPTEYKKIAKGICRYHMHMHKLDVMKPLTFVRMFENLKAYHNPEIIDLLHMVGCADHRGRLGNEDSDVKHLNLLYDYFLASKNVDFAYAVENFTKGNKIPQGEQAKQLMEKARSYKIMEFKSQKSDTNFKF